MPDMLVQSPPSTTERIATLNDRARLGLDCTARIIFTLNLLDSLSDGTRRNDILAQARIMKAMRDCTFSDDSPERSEGDDENRLLRRRVRVRFGRSGERGRDTASDYAHETRGLLSHDDQDSGRFNPCER